MTGEGLDELRRVLPSVAYSSLVRSEGDAPIVTRRRHREGLTRALDEVLAFRSGLEAGLPVEVAGSHLRAAETALEELLGVISVDDVLDVVFRQFCVGK